MSPAIALEKSQGWKLHVSAAYGQEMRVLKLAIPFLLREKVDFKIVKSERMYHDLEKEAAQKGKLIAIYPMGGKKPVQLAQELENLFNREDFTPDAFMPPLNEMVFSRSGAVSYRFGAYSTVTTICKGDFSFIIQKALKQNYYPLTLDSRDLRRVPFVKSPFPEVLPKSWDAGIDEMLEKKLYIDAQIALCTGEGLGGIRQTPITESELPIFFEKIKKIIQKPFPQVLLHPFMFTVQREKHEILHNLVCTALFYLARQPEKKVADFISGLGDYNIIVAIDMAPDELKDIATKKTVPFKQLFQENTDFGDFDQFLRNNNVEATINHYWGKMKAYFDEKGWPEKGSTW